MAYTKFIDQNSKDSHQTSPAYVLTFTRWRNRDTLNYTESAEAVRKPLVVVNDAIQISVTTQKNKPSPTFSCRLRAGDINYATAIHPGDFVVVNMVNWETKAMEIRERALQSRAINNYDDGFKGVFKILDVKKTLITSPTGLKQYVFDVTARAFDELNNFLYFNPAIVDDQKKASPLYFLQAFGKDWHDLVQKKESNNVQELVKNVIKSTIGTGTIKTGKGSIPQNEIPRYQLPPSLGKLVNKERKKLYASDLNNYYLGIWNPKPSFSISAQPSDGFNSFFSQEGDGNFYTTGGENYKLQGSRQLAMQDFQNVKVWSLIKNYSNSLLNETYATFRVADDGYVYPSLIVRQKPYNNRHYKKNSDATTHTQFLDIPRWKIHPNLITQASIGRSDSGRINFVQVFTRSLSVDPNFNQAAQIQQGNFVADEKDIIRNGMKPYIATCNFDYPSGTKELRAKEWANLVADWVLNGHLKMNGTLTTIGIEEPVCIGDNLELDNTVFQIESVTHNMTISPDGKKSFRTSMTLSMGIDDRSTTEVPVYAEMDNTDSFEARKEDYLYEQMLPGFSDTQDLPSRQRGEEVKETLQATFTNPKNSDKGGERNK